MKKYFKARGLKENYDPQNKHKDIFYFAEDTGQLLLDGVSYSEATDLTPYAKATNLPDTVLNEKISIVSRTNDVVVLKFNGNDLNANTKVETYIHLHNAETTKAGVMSASDKVKLDSLVKYKAGNGIDITGDTISCTLDTSLYSIVTELPETGLPNKIYLLPSTETEEGNIYTEYGYVDNKWEEIGKYKADIDLSNYVQKTDVVTETTNGLMLASDKTKLDDFEEAEQYTKAINLPDSVISNVGIYKEGGAHIYIKSTKDNLIDGSHDEIKVEIPIAEKYKVGLMPTSMYSKIDSIPNGIVGENSLGPLMRVTASNTAVWLKYNEYYFINDSNKEVSLEIPVATTNLCGVMAPEDKVKLDSLVNYQAGDNINIKDGVINANTWIQFEMLDFVESDSNQHTYNYNGIVIKDGSFSGSGSGIVFDKADIKYRTYTTSPKGVSTVCFALNDDIRRKIDNAITSISINDVEQVNTNGAVDLTIPNATPSKAGLMSADDKSKLANPISYYYRNAGIDTKLTDSSADNTCYIGSPVLEILGNKVEFKGAKICTSNGTPYIDCSTSKAVASLLDGLMSKEDKAKLDSQPTIKASNATGVTDDDYIVIKKSEYQSILDRLSALEGS